MTVIRYLFLLWITLGSTVLAESVQIPSGVDHDPWDALLKQYVDERGFVDYAAWKANPESMKKLDAYLDQFKPEPSSTRPDRDEEIAGLINLYNALTIDWILKNYPVKSIRKTTRPWKEKRFLVGGQRVSLDEIEHDTLRPAIDWKVHSVIVCAARSCPPLSREAMTTENWEAQVQDRYQVWFARSDLHQYEPAKTRARVSKIFQWFSEDFTEPNSIRELLLRFGPERYRALFQNPQLSIRYMEYHWGLNDQSGLGSDYNHGWF